METPNSSWTIAIIDASKTRYSGHIKSMEETGLRVEYISPNSPDYLQTALALNPDVVLLNLFLNGKSTLTDIKEIKRVSEQLSRDIKIIIITAHNSINNIRESVKAGADDFVLEPIHSDILLQRIRYQLQDRESFKPDEIKSLNPLASEVSENQNNEGSFQLLYDTLRVLSEITDSHTALTSVLHKVAELATSNRVNLIEGDLETSKGYVVASSDDPALSYLNIDLEKYPEVREVLLNGNIIYIKDITQNPLTKDIQSQVKSIKITSLLVFPIRHRSQTLGSLNIRLAGEQAITQKNLKTFYMVALTLGPKLAAQRLLRKYSSNAPTNPPLANLDSTPSTSETPNSDHQE